MSAIKIVCLGCKKRFSGELDKLKAINSCPRCKKSGAWWTQSEPAETASPVSPIQSIANQRPVPVVPQQVQGTAPLRRPSPSTPGIRPIVSARAASHPSRSSLLILVIASAVIVIPLVSFGAYWLGTRSGPDETGGASGSNSATQDSGPSDAEKQRRERKDAADRVAAEEVVNSFADLHSRLRVGLTYADYTKTVGDLQVGVDRLDRTLQATPFALTIFMTVKLVLEHHLFAQALWQNTLRDRNQLIYSSDTLKFLTDKYGLEQRTLTATGEKYALLSEALALIWAKAGTDLSTALRELDK